MADLAALKSREKQLTEKIAKLKSGELVSTISEGDGRQEEAVMRSEKWLRDVRKAITEEEKPKGKTK